MRHACNGTLVPDQVARGGFREMGIKDSVEATCFVCIALYAIFDVFWCVAREVIGLSLHGTDTCIEEEELERS
jgi:hypothetical protein